MNHIARCGADHKAIIIHADTLDHEWKDNVQNIISFLQHSIESYHVLDVFIGEIELLSDYELLLDYIA